MYQAAALSVSPKTFKAQASEVVQVGSNHVSFLKIRTGDDRSLARATFRPENSHNRIKASLEVLDILSTGMAEPRLC